MMVPEYETCVLKDIWIIDTVSTNLYIALNIECFKCVSQHPKF